LPKPEKDRNRTGPQPEKTGLQLQLPCFCKVAGCSCLKSGAKKKPDATGFNRLQPVLLGVQNRHQMGARYARIASKTSPKSAFLVIFNDFLGIFYFL